MPNATDVLVGLYAAFNGRDIDAALAAMHENVVWANGMDGGYVTGHAGVRSYWTRQWATIDTHAEPQASRRVRTELSRWKFV